MAGKEDEAKRILKELVFVSSSEGTHQSSPGRRGIYGLREKFEGRRLHYNDVRTSPIEDMYNQLHDDGYEQDEATKEWKYNRKSET